MLQKLYQLIMLTNETSYIVPELKLLYKII